MQTDKMSEQQGYPQQPAYGYPQQPAPPGYPAGGYPQPVTQQPPQPFGGPQQPPQYYGGQQQPANTVVVVQNQSVPTQSFVGHIVFSCVVLWCCGCLCGLIAFILAMVASDRASSGDKDSARSLGHASMAFSIIGLLVGLAAIIYFVVVYAIIVDKATSIVKSGCYYSSYNVYKCYRDDSLCYLDIYGDYKCY